MISTSVSLEEGNAFVASLTAALKEASTRWRERAVYVYCLLLEVCSRVQTGQFASQHTTEEPGVFLEHMLARPAAELIRSGPVRSSQQKSDFGCL